LGRRGALVATVSTLAGFWLDVRLFLGGREDERPERLSGGQQQRAAIAPEEMLTAPERRETQRFLWRLLAGGRL